MKKTRVATKLMFAAIIISLLCVPFGLLSACRSEPSSAPSETFDENTTSEATDAESTTEFSEAVSALLETTDENTKWIIAKTREDYYPRESETMPGDDNDKLLTEKQAIAILNARIAPDNDKMIREIDHKVVINGKPYFLAHAYTVGRDFTFTHGWYIVDRETGDLYKAYAAADLYYYVEKD
ncbi:MAG: hypothetical protein EGR44_10395 [Ruminococcaceae bacterium]|nr:hypothetical protein [Oscillospiraceae bacterium]